MTIECFATQVGSYPAELTRRALFAGYARTAANTPGLIAGGLVSASDLQLSAPASGMSVNVSAGEAIVGGSSGTTQGGYYFRNTAQASLSVAAANPSNPRVDAVVATVADAGYPQPSDVGATTNGGVLAVVTGTPTAGATLSNLSGAPVVPLSSLLLGYVLVPASSTSVTSGNVANKAIVISALPLSNVVQLVVPQQLRLQYGTSTFTQPAGWQGNTITYPTAYSSFSNAYYAVSPATVSTIVSHELATATTTGMTVDVNSSAAQTINIQWLAVGR